MTIKEVKGLSNLTKSQARAAEQALIERGGLSNLANQINSIYPTNPIYENAINIGNQLIKNIIL